MPIRVYQESGLEQLAPFCGSNQVMDHHTVYALDHALACHHRDDVRGVPSL
jgi:hypothetical protein